MGKSQRDKGYRTENALVNAFKSYSINAKRVPLSGGTEFCKGDLIVPLKGQDFRLESKARANGFKQIYDWLEGNDMLAIKADRKETLVVIPLKQFCEIVAAEEEPCE